MVFGPVNIVGTQHARIFRRTKPGIALDRKRSTKVVAVRGRGPKLVATTTVLTLAGAFYCLLFSVCCSGASTSGGGVVDDPFRPRPLDQYEVWERFESARENYPQLLEQSFALGHSRALRTAEADGVWYWWVFYLEPGVYDAPVFRLETTAGDYESIAIMFTAIQQQVAWTTLRIGFDSLAQPIAWPFTADSEKCESVTERGKTRVVAYVRFSEEPRGDLVRWEVLP